MTNLVYQLLVDINNIANNKNRFYESSIIRATNFADKFLTSLDIKRNDSGN